MIIFLEGIKLYKSLLIFVSLLADKPDRPINTK